MTTEAAVLADQLVPLEQLRGRFAEPGIYSQFDHVVMALKARRLTQPLGIHRIFPEMVGGISIFLVPVFADVGGNGGMRRILKTGSRTLAFVAARAAEFLHGVRAGGGQI